MKLAILLLAFAAQSGIPIATTPGCLNYAKGMKHIPNVPACGNDVADDGLSKFVREHKHLIREVQSCDKRDWPASDWVCEGIALGFAHSYVMDNLDTYGPDALKPKSIPSITYTVSGITSIPANLFYAPQNPPLVCPKYQHVEHWPGGCGPVPCNENTCIAVCAPPPPDKCVDDMHELTEREWQELMQRVEKLEKKAKHD